MGCYCHLAHVTKCNCSCPTWAPLEKLRYVISMFSVLPFLCVFECFWCNFKWAQRPRIPPNWPRLWPKGPPLLPHVILLTVWQVPSVTKAIGNQCVLTHCDTSEGVLLKQTEAATVCWPSRLLESSDFFFDAISSRQCWSAGRWPARPKWTMKACQTARLHKLAGRHLTGDVSCHRPSQQTETHKSYVILLSFMCSLHKRLLSPLTRT